MLKERFGSLRGAFSHFNTNSRREGKRKDHRLDTDELRRGLKQVGCDAKLAEKFLGALDCDGDGNVSFEEFVRSFEDDGVLLLLEVEQQTDAALMEDTEYLRRCLFRVERRERNIRAGLRIDEQAAW